MALTGAPEPLLMPSELYGAASIGLDGVASLYHIDPGTGAGTLIGSTGFQRVSAMSFDPSGRLLAVGERNDGSNISVLISIDLATGSGTEIGPTNVAATGFGDNVTDIAFRHGDGALYAYIMPSGGVGVIDPATGTITAVGSSGLVAAGNGIAFDWEDTLLHADATRLNRLDQTTGTATQVALLTWSPPADSFPRVNAMDFDPSNVTLYASVQDGGGGSESYLAIVLSDGVVSIIGAAPSGLDALAWRPKRSVATLPPMPPALYGAAYNGPDGQATLYRLDPASGKAAFIGPIGFERVSGMDFDAYGTLYATGERADGSNTNVLLTIDVRTGRGTEVGPTNVLATGFGDTFSDIDFRRTDGALFGYVEPGDGVAVIDPLTGASTPLGHTGSAGCCGNAIAFDRDGTLLHHANELVHNVLDQTTGGASFLSGTSYLSPFIPGTRANGMDVHPATGVMYVSIRSNGGFGNWLGTIDLITGVVKPIGRSVPGLDAIAWGGVTCGVVDFEGLAEFETIGTVGGAVSVTFEPNWTVVIDDDAGGVGNFANEPSPDTVATHFIGLGTPPIIELSSGVRFVRVSTLTRAPPLEIHAHDLPGGGGNLVSFDVRSTQGVAPPAPCAGDPNGTYCLWDAHTLVSPTDNIRSLVIYGSVPRDTGYDDLTWCQGPPDLLYGSSFTGPNGLATLHRLDPHTGVATLVGPIGFQRVSAMDFDANGTLYATGERNDGSDTSVLLTIDTATGAGAEVGPTGVVGLGFGDTFADMSLRNADNTLFAFIAPGNGLSVIDLTTGSAGVIGPTTGGAGNTNGLAFDAGDTLFHADTIFHILDQSTGAASVAGTLIWPSGFGAGPLVNGMDFHPRMRVPYVSVNNAAAAHFLGTVSLVTYAVDLIGPTVPGLDAIAWLTVARPPIPPEVSPPGAAVPLRVTTAVPGQLRLEWEPTMFADSYRVLIGDFFAIRPMSGVVQGNASSTQCGITATTHIIPMPPGNVFLLVAADNSSGTGPLGVGETVPLPRRGNLICP